jgi:hypothetical protein
LDISGVVLGMFVVGCLIIPLITSWRLVVHLWRLRRQTPSGYPSPPFGLGSVLIHVVAVLWTLLSFLYINQIIYLLRATTNF